MEKRFDPTSGEVKSLVGLQNGLRQMGVEFYKFDPEYNKFTFSGFEQTAAVLTAAISAEELSRSSKLETEGGKPVTISFYDTAAVNALKASLTRLGLKEEK